MLSLYHRDNCHLCEVMYADLLQWQSDNQRIEEVELIDIDSQPELLALLGNKIPVLMRGGEELCFGRFDSRSI